MALAAARFGQRQFEELRTLRRRWRPSLSFWLGCAALLPDFSLPAVRAFLFRKAGCDLAPGVALLGHVKLVGPGQVAARLHMKPGCIIAPGITFGLDADIHLGKKVSVSPGTVLYTATHGIGMGSQRMLPFTQPKPISIEDGAWVGMHCLILPGVTIGHGAVVSAGSVVTTNVPPDTLVAGNPASVQHSLPFGDR
jgi:acetyltransferase-like isoleucine patch superfamily enzyme